MSTTPLTETQQAALSARLDDRERELQAEVRAVNEEAADTPTREPQLQVGDLGEQGEERIRDAVRYAEKERDIQELRQIADARERLREGSYGLCIDCGTAIPLARLEALPFSERCVPCQEAFETTHPTSVRIPTAP